MNLARSARRWLRRQPRWLRRLARRWAPLTPRSAEPELDPSPAVAAFLDGETVRQVAYFVGAADPGIIDPADDWPGALADAHAVIRSYITRLQDYIKERSL
jgi:hypothetical protein